MHDLVSLRMIRMARYPYGWLVTVRGILCSTLFNFQFYGSFFFYFIAS